MNSTDQILVDVENTPWYQSTRGPQLSQTLKGVAALVLPLVQTMFPSTVTTGIVWIDRGIDIILIAGFGLYALIGYIKAKKVLGARISTLQQQVGALGAQPKA